MILNAKVYKEKGSDWWILEIIELNRITQGKNLYDAIDMGIDLIRCIAEDNKLPVGITVCGKDNQFKYVSFSVEPNEELLKQIT